MTVEIGSDITLDVERPAVGGRMIARHGGQVVLVWGAIPGERVRARVERFVRGVLFADTVEVLTASPDRRDARGDWRCGGNVFAHIGYERQRALKGEILRDALGRIGHIALDRRPDVVPSPERGYRMRARLHVRGNRLGFLREGTHQWCEAGPAGQLHPGALQWIAAAERLIDEHHLGGLVGVEVAENIGATERACHLELQRGVDAAPFAVLAGAGPLTGLSAGRVDHARTDVLMGTPEVSETLDPGAAGPPLRLVRSVRSFFQGNRFLLEPLAQHVVGLVPGGPVADLYAGVGLFGLALAANGAQVTLVEGDPVSGRDLEANAAPFATRVRVERRSVESYFDRAARRGASGAAEPASVVIVDPPRTGMSAEAVAGVIRARPPRLIYVSCDPATCARDARALLAGGYALDGLTGFDLFPNTAHVESVALFVRSDGRDGRSDAAR